MLMKMNMKTRVIVKNAIKCKHCGDAIESKHRHDFKHCSCKRCAVDGGLDYLRRVGNPTDYEDISKFKEIDVEQKFNVGDIVEFEYLMSNKTGIIQTVDTYPCLIEVEYDIFVKNENTLYKHIREKCILDIIKVFN